MTKTLTVIIPVSERESVETIQRSINTFECMHFYGFDAKVVYAVDDPGAMRPYYREMEPSEHIEFLWVTDTSLRQASAYNAALRKYPDSDYYAFFDVDAIPVRSFFQICASIDADFVSCDRYVGNYYINSMTKTISEEYKFCNRGRRAMYKLIGKFFPASCTGLIRGEVLHDFRFTEMTSTDSELYRHILCNDISMGYAYLARYSEYAPTTTKQLYSQRLRWISDAWRTCVKTIGSGKNWRENITNLAMYAVGMFPIVGLVLLTNYRGRYNSILHSIFMQYISLIALLKTIKNDEVKWD